MVVHSGTNTDCKSSEPLKTLVMLCYCGERRPSSACSRVGVGSNLSRRLEPSGSLVHQRVIVTPAVTQAYLNFFDACRRRLQPFSASGAVWVSTLTTSCLLSSLSGRFCKEKLRMSRFAKRGNTVQLRLGVRLCLFRGRRMGDILRMAFTQNRVRSYTGASLSLTVCLLSYGPPPSISLTQPFTHHSISCDP